MTISLSSTTAGPDTLSPTFASNVGADVLTVFSGNVISFTSLTGPGLKPFDTIVQLMTPFTFEATSGTNLLLDVTVPSCPVGAFISFDAANVLNDSVSVVRASNAGSSTGFPNTTYGLVTQFTLTRALSLNLALNTHSVAVGDVVQVSISPVNPGAAEVVDVYFAILLPAASGPSLGCPNGDAAAFFGNALSTVVVTCVSARAETFPILFQNLSIPAGLAATGVNNFFSFTWPATAPAGTYTFAIFATPPNAFADGTIDSGDVPTFAFDSLSFSP